MSSNIINKSKIWVNKNFNEIYNNRNRYQSFHFALGWHRNRLLDVGINNVDETCPKVISIAKKFGVYHFVEYPYKHAEVDLLLRLWGKFKIDRRLTIVVLRMNKYKKFKNSKPCINCKYILNSLSVKKVWYSNENGDIKSNHNSSIECNIC